ncbi:hypothetical protein Bca101_082371 [Brassica carinata]
MFLSAISFCFKIVSPHTIAFAFYLIGSSHKSPPQSFGRMGQLPSHDIMAELEFKKRIKHDPTWFVLHGTMIPSTSMGIFLQVMVLSLCFAREGETFLSTI